ncbi:hypothetical protein M0802_015412 [Mischocyttarus mexicanus]|nr:hypothetical protein M0802_015412 [Mischocyttarus mexicanus]
MFSTTAAAAAGAIVFRFREYKLPGYTEILWLLVTQSLKKVFQKKKDDDDYHDDDDDDDNDDDDDDAQVGR